MPNSIKKLEEAFKEGKYDQLLKDIYVDESVLAYQQERYIKALESFEKIYGEKEVEIYSAPGRSEVGGNHTDHQFGKVLATSINLDAIAIVAKRDDDVIDLKSEGYERIIVSLSSFDPAKAEKGTSQALIQGVASKLKEEGYKIGDLYPDDTNPVGVVFAVNGKSGKVVGFEETTNLAWGPTGEIGTSDDGAENMAKIQTIEEWETKYPAFEWCANRSAVDGKNWYLPSQKEVEAIIPNITAINEVIKALGKNAIAGYWWTSTESATDATNKAFVAGPTGAKGQDQAKTTASAVLRVRAILAF